MADESIEKGLGAGVLKNINKLIDAGIRTRFQKVIETKKHASDSVEAGRACVAAYVDYLRFVENINTLLTAKTRFDHGNEIRHLENKHTR